ncbi:hypothetical protein J7E93_00470 [Streptomyces sp. ISL-36]|uniref:hypothetical protein n=1 Tax=Streptomyces sp. ISL-36 TaxID=2819182 RepID=UPI001BE66D84|nr:hypothetical protein [Streptomyces sp. ISL-36]MBT2438624.1 hypothetical protein [Streptomyces sp. ISL-36]
MLKPQTLERFGVFAECLLVGVWIAVASLPLVTLPAALAAGAAHLRRWTGDEESGWRAFVADLRSAARRGWIVGVASWAALALVGVDLLIVRAGLPGGRLVGALGILAAIGMVVAVLRACAAWRPDSSWRSLLAAAARRTVRDPAGSLLVVCGFAVIAASAWFVVPLAAPALGVAMAATLAVERRAAGR